MTKWHKRRLRDLSNLFSKIRRPTQRNRVSDEIVGNPVFCGGYANIEPVAA